jgi:hypothetical protein
MEESIEPLSGLQLREVLAELAWLNLRIKDRPVYQSSMNLLLEEYEIVAKLPKHLELGDPIGEVRGALLHRVFAHAMHQIRIEGVPNDEAEDVIKSGRFSLTWDADGNWLLNTNESATCPRRSPTARP